MGVGAVSTRSTADVAADATVADAKAAFFPVTRTVMRAPACAVVRVSDDAVAFEIATPFAYHWYPSAAPDVHAPGAARSVCPTVAVPLIVGTDVSIRCSGSSAATTPDCVAPAASVMVRAFSKRGASSHHSETAPAAPETKATRYAPAGSPPTAKVPASVTGTAAPTTVPAPETG
ncbi:hypothetical protein D8M34_04380 [Microbacterium sp. HSID17254]|nr:hypothetical protein D8M34_04380 [Microbacterium sp. HSID17254]